MFALRQINRLGLLATLLVIATLASLFGGCGNGRPPTYPVQGIVRFVDGRPVPVGFIEFRSEVGGHNARGKLDQQGKFTLSTFQKGDGAVEGLHKVIVVQNFDPIVFESGHQEPPHEEAGHEHEGQMLQEHEHDPMFVHLRFATYETSGLTATVKPQAENSIELVVGEPVKQRLEQKAP